MKTLRGYGVLLRPLEAADLEMVRQWRNAAHVRENFEYQGEISEADQERWFREMDKARNFYWVILRGDGGGGVRGMEGADVGEGVLGSGGMQENGEAAGDGGGRRTGGVDGEEKSNGGLHGNEERSSEEAVRGNKAAWMDNAVGNEAKGNDTVGNNTENNEGEGKGAVGNNAERNEGEGKGAVGIIHAKEIDWEYKTAEAGIFIGEKEYLGGAVAGGAILAMMDYLFAELGFEELRAKVKAEAKENVKLNRQLGYELLPGQEGKPFQIYRCTRGAYYSSFRSRFPSS